VDLVMLKQFGQSPHRVLNNVYRIMRDALKDLYRSSFFMITDIKNRFSLHFVNWHHTLFTKNR